MRSIVWFRKDLRVHDNKAIFEAAEASYDGIVGLYIIDADLWTKNHVAASHVDFVLRGVAQLSETLAKLNIPLLIRQTKNTAEVPEIVLAAAKQVNATDLFVNREYELNETQRDDSVQAFLAQHKIKTHAYHDQMVLEPRTEHAKSFAIYKKLWVKSFIQQSGLKLMHPIYEQRDLEIAADPVPTHIEGFKSTVNPKLWPAGETVALKRLDKFIKTILPEYEQNRDIPALDGTSKLSPYLATGMLSPRQCFLAALEANDYRLGMGDPGPVVWLEELMWRDYYKHLIFTVPRLSLHKAYQEETETVQWAFDQAQFDAWKEGKTGYPIVDAGMRQLKAKGWMHPKLRMITATFLTKCLFFDWRLGEDYFMQNLVDGDFAFNNGNWQICASTGVDTAAYFRYFDPIRHSDRYDPDAQFIKKYCTELSDITNYAAHLPHTRAPVQAEKTKYPHPIIDLKDNREKAVTGFRAGLTKKTKGKYHDYT